MYTSPKSPPFAKCEDLKVKSDHMIQTDLISAYSRCTLLMCHFKNPVYRTPLVPSEHCECYTNDPSFPNISLKKPGNDWAKNAFALHFISLSISRKKQEV